MQRRYRTVDVFTAQMFGGNPLAVVLDAQGLSTRAMQSMAAEFNYSETTFVFPPQDPNHAAHIRIFTPRTEVPFAGHPNVGTAFVLARQREEEGKSAADHFVFEEGAGLVSISLIRERGVIVGAELQAPEALSRRGAISVEQVANCVAVDRSDILTDPHRPEVVSVGLPFLVAELASADALRRASPNPNAFAELLSMHGVDAAFVYARTPMPASSPAAIELNARMFAPLDGVLEDPATGSAAAATCALLATLAPDRDARHTWRVQQGAHMGRPSLLLCRTLKIDSAVVSVHLSGRCFAMMSGTFDIG